MKYPDEAQVVLQRLNENYEAVIVGGFVRDNLLNIPSDDIDIATSATPKQVKELFHDAFVYDTGIQHGTVTVVINKKPIEVTTYRIEKEYQDFRHPTDVVFTSNLKEDLARRDFTINALCTKGDDQIIDYYHGLDDLKENTIRAIGDPKQRFNEDALRILRAVRFSAQLHFAIEENTKSALFLCKDNLKNIAIERVMKEMDKILITDQVDQILIEYHDIFRVFLPELSTLKDHPELYQAMLERMHYCPPLTTFRFAALFADIGIIRQNEPVAMVSASCFLTLAQRLKLPNGLISKIAMLIQCKDLPLETDRIQIKKRLSRWNENYFEILNWMEVLHPNHEAIQQIKCITQEIIAAQECVSIKQLQIDGNDCLDAGFFGSQISTILNQCLMDVIEDKIPNQKEILLQHLKELKPSH